MTAIGSELVTLNQFKQASEVIVDCIKLNPTKIVFVDSNDYNVDSSLTHLYCLIKKVRDDITFPLKYMDTCI